MTVYRKRQEFGTLDESRSNISDGELLVFFEDFRRNEPESEEVIVMCKKIAKGSWLCARIDLEYDDDKTDFSHTTYIQCLY